MDEPLLVDYFTRLVDGILMLDVHWGEEQFWDECCLTEGEGDAIAVLHVLLDKIKEEDGDVGNALLVTELDGLVYVGNPLFLW